MPHPAWVAPHGNTFLEPNTQVEPGQRVCPRRCCFEPTLYALGAVDSAGSGEGSRVQTVRRGRRVSEENCGAQARMNTVRMDIGFITRIISQRCSSHPCGDWLLVLSAKETNPILPIDCLRDSVALRGQSHPSIQQPFASPSRCPDGFMRPRRRPQLSSLVQAPQEVAAQESPGVQRERETLNRDQTCIQLNPIRAGGKTPPFCSGCAATSSTRRLWCSAGHRLRSRSQGRSTMTSSSRDPVSTVSEP